MPAFHEIWVGVMITVISGILLGTLAWVVKQVIYVKSIVIWSAKQMANDGNGSWRSSVDRRLTALEIATDGVQPQPEPKSLPPLKEKDAH